MNQVHKFFNTTNNYLHRSFGVRVRADIVSQLLGSPEGTKMLDLGCGNGAISTQFIKSNKITFVDLSENMISLVKSGLGEDDLSNATLLVGSLFELDMDKDYDHIFAIGLLAHVPSVEDCVTRISSMLKPGGSAVIQFSDYGHWLTRMNIRNSVRYGYKINKLSYGDMRELVSRGDWTIEKEVQFSLTLPGMGKLPDSILYRYSSLFWKNKTLSLLGSDYIWHLRKI